MAIFIRYFERNSETMRDSIVTQELHIPGDKPNCRPFEVRSVMADGDELAVILETCVNLPHTKKRVQHWEGDFAKFIVANMW